MLYAIGIPGHGNPYWTTELLTLGALATTSLWGVSPLAAIKPDVLPPLPPIFAPHEAVREANAQLDAYYVGMTAALFSLAAGVASYQATIPASPIATFLTCVVCGACVLASLNAYMVRGMRRRVATTAALTVEPGWDDEDALRAATEAVVQRFTAAPGVDAKSRVSAIASLRYRESYMRGVIDRLRPLREPAEKPPSLLSRLLSRYPSQMD